MVSEGELAVVDWTVFNRAVHVIVQHRKSRRRYRCSGEIGIDGQVEPLSVTSYRPHVQTDEDLAEAAVGLAERHVDAETPYTIYDGADGQFHREPCLRGFSWSDTQQLRHLTAKQKTRLIDKLHMDEIDLSGEDDGRGGDQ